MVPPNWESPTKARPTWIPGRGLEMQEQVQPMHNQSFEDAAAEWRDGLRKWEEKGRAEFMAEHKKSLEYWEYEGAPPDRKYYRPWKPEEATWFQVWETVSEGTPVTPAFETREGLVDYLVANGDFWDQKRGEGGWERPAAEEFVGSGWAPTAIVAGGAWIEPRDSDVAKNLIGGEK